VSQTVSAVGNLVLTRLAPADFASIEPHLEPVDLPVRADLEKPDQPIRHVYFPDQGIASVVASSRTSKRTVEIGLIGREGMTGIPVLLGNDNPSHHAYMQVGGSGRKLPAGVLRDALGHSVSLRTSLLKFVHAFMIQVGQTAVVNIQSRLDERLARWLLMAHDRLEGDVLPITHEFLSIMLGVRRAGVTVATNEFEQQGLISLGRGQIVLQDRVGLQKIAGSAYGVPEAALKRLYGAPIKTLSGDRR